MRNNFFLTYKDSILPAIFVLICLLSIITIFSPHIENDELVYQFLGVKLANLQGYNLQHSILLKHLSQHSYNTPIFFRPPVFMIYLAVLFRLLGIIGLHFSPVIVFVAFIFVVYKTVFVITNSQNTALKALVLSSASSLVLFSSLQIHVDLFMALMITLSFYFLLVFRQKSRKMDIFLSGLFLALAVMTKYTAALCYPIYILALFSYSKKNFLLNSLLFLTPLIMVGIWLYITLFVEHMTIASLASAPDKEELTNFPFVRYVYHRPFYFYFLNIFATNPLYLFLFLLFKKNIWKDLHSKFGNILYILLSIIFLSFISLTVFGMNGGTYQMRYLLLAEPFLIILLSLIPFEEFAVLWKLFWAFIAYNVFIVSFNIMWQTAEIFSFFEWLFLYSH